MINKRNSQSILNDRMSRNFHCVISQILFPSPLICFRMGMRLTICLHALPSFIKYTPVTISFPSYHRASEINSISWTRVDLLAKLNCPSFTRQSIFNTCSSRIRSSVFLMKMKSSWVKFMNFSLSQTRSLNFWIF